jgi:diadenosine tetraphosphatase ApaH/serine/threonine PP2A family protein phosphatase
MNTWIAKDFHLTKKQYLLGKVDWLVKDVETWDSLCEWWASLEFKARADKARANQMSKPLVHHYGADGHVRKVQRTI